SKYARGGGWGDRRTGASAADGSTLLRAVSGSDHVRHRRGPERDGDAAAALWRRALRDLLSVPGDRGRVLRLRAGAHPAARPVADLRPRTARIDLEEGLPRQRRTAVARGLIAISPP